MEATPPARWNLADLAATGDLAREYGVGKATISNWISRYPDFPSPLVELSTGPVYSSSQVRRWHDSRKWTPGKHGK
ncbi:hypothetical protein AB0I61_17440 [Polymorphospora rubra]|uniref:hypothetical protein n=1 Tax=Polymorphospora rubra TaxID=338584 RepID=UPI0033F1E8CA